jgi:hypothetical protein
MRERAMKEGLARGMRWLFFFFSGWTFYDAQKASVTRVEAI